MTSRRTIITLHDASTPSATKAGDALSSCQSLAFNFIPNQTTIQELIEYARKVFHKKNLSLEHPNKTLATLSPLRNRLQATRNVAVENENENFLENVLNDQDIILVTMEVNSYFEERPQLYRVEFPYNNVGRNNFGIYGIHTTRLHEYHVHTDIPLMSKADISFVDLELEGDIFVRFVLPGCYHSLLNDRLVAQDVIVLPSDRVQDLLEAVSLSYPIYT